MLWGEFRRKSEKKNRMRFHFLGFLEKDGSFFGGGHHIKKVSQNDDGNGPMAAVGVWLHDATAHDLQYRQPAL